MRFEFFVISYEIPFGYEIGDLFSVVIIAKAKPSFHHERHIAGHRSGFREVIVFFELECFNGTP